MERGVDDVEVDFRAGHFAERRVVFVLEQARGRADEDELASEKFAAAVVVFPRFRQQHIADEKGFVAAGWRGVAEMTRLETVGYQVGTAKLAECAGIERFEHGAGRENIAELIAAMPEMRAAQDAVIIRPDGDVADAVVLSHGMSGGGFDDAGAGRGEVGEFAPVSLGYVEGAADDDVVAVFVEREFEGVVAVLGRGKNEVNDDGLGAGGGEFGDERGPDVARPRIRFGDGAEGGRLLHLGFAEIIGVGRAVHADEDEAGVERGLAAEARNQVLRVKFPRAQRREAGLPQHERRAGAEGADAEDDPEMSGRAVHVRSGVGSSAFRRLRAETSRSRVNAELRTAGGWALRA